MWGLLCARCNRLLYKRELGPISPRAVLPEVGTMFPDGRAVPEGHRMGYCPVCMAETYCREITEEEERQRGARS